MILSGYCIVLFKYEDEFGGLPDTDKHLTLILRPNPNTAKSLPSHWAQSVAGSEIKRNMNGLLLRGPAICLSSLKFTQHFHNHFYPSKFFRSTSYPKCNCIKNKDTQIVPEVTPLSPVFWHGAKENWLKWMIGINRGTFFLVVCSEFQYNTLHSTVQFMWHFFIMRVNLTNFEAKLVCRVLNLKS